MGGEREREFEGDRKAERGYGREDIHLRAVEKRMGGAPARHVCLRTGSASALMHEGRAVHGAAVAHEGSVSYTSSTCGVESSRSDEGKGDGGKRGARRGERTAWGKHATPRRTAAAHTVAAERTARCKYARTSARLGIRRLVLEVGKPMRGGRTMETLMRPKSSEPMAGSTSRPA